MSNKKIDLVKQITNIDPSGEEIGYMSWVNVQANLPHSRPFLHSPAERKNNTALKDLEKDLWVRQNGNYTLTVQSFKTQKNNQEINYGLPYGSIPRLLTAWVTREAVLKGERRLELGNTMGDFMRQLGFQSRSGGKTGTDNRLRDQMTRYFSSRLSLTKSDGTKAAGHSLLRNVNMVDDFDLWWNEKNPEQGSLWESEMVLGDRFFKSVTESPIPIDLRILAHPDIRRSPLAIDIYCWLTYRMATLKTPVSISWAQLQQQFGSDYSRPDHFNKKFIEAAGKVINVYSGARMAEKDDKKGILLLPGRPSVQPKIA